MTESSTPRAIGPTGLPGAASTSMPQGHAKPRRWRDLVRIVDYKVFALLAVVTLAAHAWSLRDGLFLDDHWHQARIGEMEWSISDALTVTTIDTDRLIDSWWQNKPVRWVYARPVAVLLQKCVHALSGGSVIAQHAVSLVLHFLTVCMVFQLCFLLTGHRGWSLVGGSLMAVYSHSVITVAWLAAQNAVLQTALMLAALLFYVRASGLNLRAVSIEDAGLPPREPAPIRVGSLLAFFVLWILAMFSRENAIMLSAIVVAFDLAFGGRRQLRARWWVYGVVGAIAVAFLVWRLAWHYEPMPAVYARRPDGAGYLTWCVVKLMHYLCSSVWQSPMTIGPSGRLDPLREVPGDCLLMLAILVVMGLGYYRACRRIKGWWIWPMWLTLAVLPVVPLLATPHSGYVNGVAFSVAVVLAPGCGHVRARGRSALATANGISIPIGRWCKPAALLVLIATCAYVPIYRTLYTSMVAAERITIAAITTGQPPKDVTDVFFINLPFVNVYAKQSLDEQWPEAMAGVRCHALTFAPNLLASDDPCILRRNDEHSFSLTARGRPYFSGLLGRFFLEGMRRGEQLTQGHTVEADGFHVRIDQVEDAGVRALTFVFSEPLSSPRYRFYMSTPECPALEVRFDGGGVDRPLVDPLVDMDAPVGVDVQARAEARPSVDRPAGDRAVETEPADRHNLQSLGDRLFQGDAQAGAALFTALDDGDPILRDRAWSFLEPVVVHVARATGSPVQDLLRVSGPPDDVPGLRRWWRDEVDNTLLDRTWLRRHDLDALRRARGGFARVRAVAGQIIRTDLYLSGPPFAGPCLAVPHHPAGPKTAENH